MTFHKAGVSAELLEVLTGARSPLGLDGRSAAATIRGICWRLMKAMPALFIYYEKQCETLHRSFGRPDGHKGWWASRMLEGRQEGLWCGHGSGGSACGLSIERLEGVLACAFEPAVGRDAFERQLIEAAREQAGADSDGDGPTVRGALSMQFVDGIGVHAPHLA